MDLWTLNEQDRWTVKWIGKQIVKQSDGFMNTEWTG